eukprot:6265471-Amphidinium_carterae.1
MLQTNITEDNVSRGKGAHSFSNSNNSLTGLRVGTNCTSRGTTVDAPDLYAKPNVSNRGSTPTPPQSQGLKEYFPKVVPKLLKKTAIGEILFETLGLGRGGGSSSVLENVEWRVVRAVIVNTVLPEIITHDQRTTAPDARRQQARDHRCSPLDCLKRARG